MIETFELTDMSQAMPAVRRVVQGYATARSWRRLLARSAFVVGEVAWALPRDLKRLSLPAKAPIRRLEAGLDPQIDASRIALYVHYSPHGRVSEMVRRQLLFLGQAEFAVVFISMSENLPESDWQAVRGLCALVAQRFNNGRDFGAWKDMIPEVMRRWGDVDELLLVNDSVLGPIYPIGPVIRALRSGGDGLFGLTESLQGGPHLQSYMLLARGRGAVADLMGFLKSVFISQSKWLLVQLTEVRLSRWMRRRGHRVAALFGYDRLIRAAWEDAGERQRIVDLNRAFAHLGSLSTEEAIGVLHAIPLNPTHHLWHVLATRFGGPFVKTELVLRNPGRLPDVGDWPTIVPVNAPCSAAILRDHLAAMKAA